jgi:hypothetical protein
MALFKHFALLPLALVAVILIYPLGLPYYLNAVISGILMPLFWGLFNQDLKRIEVGGIFFIGGFVLLIYAIYISNKHEISLQLLHNNALNLSNKLSNLPFVSIALLTTGTFIIIKAIIKGLTHPSSGTR